MTRKRVTPFPAEVPERGADVLEQERELATQWTAICSVAADRPLGRDAA